MRVGRGLYISGGGGMFAFVLLLGALESSIALVVALISLAIALAAGSQPRKRR